MKANEGVEVQLHEFLTSTLNVGECSDSPSGRFTLCVEAGWALEMVLDAVVKAKIPCLCRESNCGRLARSLVTSH